ncbi:MAG: glycosyltransferase family 1 protein [Patescibacteria group bacterium]|nr:glycosyltransferase family 1 protein [Patescibacteria group bacterium]MDD5715680.1 glycosyltransferase family 1 protein [Patescibacteria group bacterium]
MKIGIDCRTALNPKLGERAGVGHYTYYLVQHIMKHDHANEYVLFFDWRFRDMREFEQKNITVKNFPFSQYNRFLPFAYSHMLISAFLVKESLDVFHSPITSLPLTYPKKSIVTVHDLAIYKNPSWFPSQIFSTKLLVPQSLRKADAIIAVSQSTKRDLRDIFNVPPKKIHVIYEGAMVDRIPVKNSQLDNIKRFKLGPKYILFVGTLTPRKNIISLIRAYKQLISWEPGFSEYQLVLAGAKDFENEKIFDEINALKLKKHVRYLGYITHNQKMALMKGAACFVFPSSYEGFGLPVLEAMKLGTPVVTSNTSSLPEIAGKGALLVDPEHDRDIAIALRKVLSDKKLRAQLIERARKQAAEFTWDRCARETVKLYTNLG